MSRKMWNKENGVWDLWCVLEKLKICSNETLWVNEWDKVFEEYVERMSDVRE